MDDLLRVVAVTNREIPAKPPARVIAWLRCESWTAERGTLARGFLARRDLWDQITTTVTSAEVFAEMLLAENDHDPHRIARLYKTQRIVLEQATATVEALRPLHS